MALPATPTIQRSLPAGKPQTVEIPEQQKRSNKGRLSPKVLLPKFFGSWSRSRGSSSLLSPISPTNSTVASQSIPPSIPPAHPSTLPTRFLHSAASAALKPTLVSDNHFNEYDTTTPHLEEPLRRPQALNPDTPHEKPLARPREVGLHPNFHEIPTAIAIDISGSTEGLVLEQEILASQTICGLLSDGAKTNVRIIPWDDHNRGVRLAKSIHTLTSKGGGTVPSVLTSGQNTETTVALKNCSCFLLFTDGEIEEKEIRNFSDGIRRNGLHGTACVVVIFGYKPYKPINCNVSVGLSMFSAAPDCLFLFHDIDTADIYLLQSKGAFNELLPDNKTEIVFGTDTLWHDLPKITYQDLLRVRIPAPQKLAAGDILLQSNRMVGLQDVYDDKVDAATASELIDNDENLNSLLLTCQISGEHEKVARWIQKQKTKDKNMLFITRPDVDSEAALYVQLLIQEFNSGSSSRERGILQGKLREAHQVNWTRLVSEAGIEQLKSHRRSRVVEDSMARIEKSRDGQFFVDEGQCSPALLTPVRTILSSKRPHENHVPFSTTSQESLAIDNPPSLNILYIPGYRYDRGTSSAVGLEGTCPLCNSPNSVLSLLLKRPPPDITTHGFPLPNSRSGLAFPLAMGTFPETDILSPFVCCDACAYHLVQIQQSPYDEEIIAAIPLIPEAIAGAYQDTTYDAVDEALQRRFEKPAIEQVLLAIIFNTLERPEGEHEETEREALRWASSMISLQTSLPASLSSSFSGHLTPRGYVRLPMALSQSLSALPKPSPPLLQYPLNGFVVMLQSMIDLNLEPRPNARQHAVFQRILFHLTEKHHEFYLADLKAATEALESIIRRPQTDLEEQESSNSKQPETSPRVPKGRIPLIALRDTHLLSEDDWDILQRLGPLFDHVKDECSCAISMFLLELEKHVSATVTPIEIFDRIRLIGSLQRVFKEPELVE